MKEELVYIGIIPARYGSTRFPGKPLAMINGKSMIRRVYEQAQKANSLSDVIVATDDDRILNHVRSFGGQCVLTSPGHNTGTERCSEAMKTLYGREIEGLIVINIQGDEPYIDPEQINQLTMAFTDSRVEIATLIKAVETPESLANPNHVKVVTDKEGFAIYFSRSPIPYYRDEKETRQWIRHHTYYKHLGIYAYRAETLNRIVNLPQEKLEKAESLEQLRWLENRYHIKTIITPFESISIDRPEDIELIEKEDFDR